MNKVQSSVVSSVQALIEAHGAEVVMAALTGNVAGRAIACRELSRSVSIPVKDKIRAGSMANFYGSLSEWLAAAPTRESIRAAKVAAKEAKK